MTVKMSKRLWAFWLFGLLVLILVLVLRFFGKC